METAGGLPGTADVLREAGSAGSAELAARLDAIATEADAAVGELRELARGIHPAALTEGGLGPALAPPCAPSCRSDRLLDDVGERLGDDEVGRRLDRRGQPELGPVGELDRDRQATGERLQRALESAV